MSTPGDYILDPPDDPPMITCPECAGTGTMTADVDRLQRYAREALVPGVEYDCLRCGGDGETYATNEEVRDWAAERQIERAEARRDQDL